MALVNKGDLTSVNNSLSYLETIVNENNSLINTINLFIANSKNELKGSAYDGVRNKLSLYIDALQKQNTICEVLKQNIMSTNNQMNNYMEEYNSLDDSNIGTVRAAINKAKSQINIINNMISGSTDSQYISELRRAIDALSKDVERLEKLLRKLEGLQPEDSELKEKLSSIVSDIANYKSAVSDIIVTSYV